MGRSRRLISSALTLLSLTRIFLLSVTRLSLKRPFLVVAHISYPYRRFADALTDADARLGATVDRYSFDVELSHLLLHAGLSRRRHRI